MGFGTDITLRFCFLGSSLKGKATPTALSLCHGDPREEAHFGRAAVPTCRSPSGFCKFAGGPLHVSSRAACDYAVAGHRASRTAEPGRGPESAGSRGAAGAGPAHRPPCRGPGFSSAALCSSGAPSISLRRLHPLPVTLWLIKSVRRFRSYCAAPCALQGRRSRI